MRSFRRYSTDIPINVVGNNISSESNRQLYNVSYGGVACHSDVQFKSGDLVSVSISLIDPPFKGKGIVVWCDPVDDGYELGIQFNEGREAFAARMVAQVCQIEQYKKHVFESEGRKLSGDEAALEWIEKNAHQQKMQERAFIRHPLDVPIEISRTQQAIMVSSKLRNYSLDGACFVSASKIKLGVFVQIQLPRMEDQPAKKMEGVVVWCCKKGVKYDVGVKFKEDDDVFNIAMLKQISQLESFKDEIKRCEGRELTGEETVSEYTAYLAKLNLKNTG